MDTLSKDDKALIRLHTRRHWKKLSAQEQQEWAKWVRDERKAERDGDDFMRGLVALDDVLREQNGLPARAQTTEDHERRNGGAL